MYIYIYTDIDIDSYRHVYRHTWFASICKEFSTHQLQGLHPMRKNHGGRHRGRSVLSLGQDLRDVPATHLTCAQRAGGFAMERWKYTLRFSDL